MVDTLTLADLLQAALIASITAISVWAVMQPGMIFGWLGNLLRKLPLFLAKPVVDCPVCMTFWYGGGFLFFLTDNWVASLIGAVLGIGLTSLLLNLYEIGSYEHTKED